MQDTSQDGPPAPPRLAAGGLDILRSIASAFAPDLDDRVHLLVGFGSCSPYLPAQIVGASCLDHEPDRLPDWAIDQLPPPVLGVSRSQVWGLVTASSRKTGDAWDAARDGWELIRSHAGKAGRALPYVSFSDPAHEFFAAVCHHYADNANLVTRSDRQVLLRRPFLACRSFASYLVGNAPDQSASDDPWAELAGLVYTVQLGPKQRKAVEMIAAAAGSVKLSVLGLEFGWRNDGEGWNNMQKDALNPKFKPHHWRFGRRRGCATAARMKSHSMAAQK